MVPKSIAERCQKYPHKHKEVYQEKDALRKRNYSQKMKANPIPNKERLRVERETKQKCRSWVKESIATATAANLVTEQNDDSAFLKANTRSRSIQKVAKTLPKSPKKRKEVISALANKFKMRIKSIQSKSGRPKNELTESEKEWFKSVLDKLDITYVTPGQKDHRYVGKVDDGKSHYVQKRYFMWTLYDLSNIANRSSLIENESSFEFSLSKKIKFHQLYQYINIHRGYIHSKDIPQQPYLCEICKNVCFVAKALNKKIKSFNIVPMDPHSLAEKYTCDYSSRTCMCSENECCYVTGVKVSGWLWRCRVLRVG